MIMIFVSDLSVSVKLPCVPVTRVLINCRDVLLISLTNHHGGADTGAGVHTDLLPGILPRDQPAVHQILR